MILDLPVILLHLELFLIFCELYLELKACDSIFSNGHQSVLPLLLHHEAGWYEWLAYNYEEKP